MREAQEETSFEGPTWYVEEDKEEEPSPRGAVHEVWDEASSFLEPMIIGVPVCYIKHDSGLLLFAGK